MVLLLCALCCAHSVVRTLDTHGYHDNLVGHDGTRRMTLASWIAWDLAQHDTDEGRPTWHRPAHAEAGHRAHTHVDETGSKDPALIERIRAGDTGAFDILCAEQWDGLYRHAYRMLGSSDAASDLVQDVLFDAWCRRAELDAGRNVRAYLFTAVHRGALAKLRHDRTVRRIRRAHEPTTVSGASDTPALADAAADEETLLAALARVLETIPAARRDVLALRWRQGLTYEEIAEITGLGVSAVKMQVRRAVETLRPLLERVFE
jgi:RNA polymerase sigma-70 factor (ECF subfamily)